MARPHPQKERALWTEPAWRRKHWAWRHIRRCLAPRCEADPVAWCRARERRHRLGTPRRRASVRPTTEEKPPGSYPPWTRGPARCPARPGLDLPRLSPREVTPDRRGCAPTAAAAETRPLSAAPGAAGVAAVVLTEPDGAAGPATPEASQFLPTVAGPVPPPSRALRDTAVPSAPSATGSAAVPSQYRSTATACTAASVTLSIMAVLHLTASLLITVLTTLVSLDWFAFGPWPSWRSCSGPAWPWPASSCPCPVDTAG